MDSNEIEIIYKADKITSIMQILLLTAYCKDLFFTLIENYTSLVNV